MVVQVRKLLLVALLTVAFTAGCAGSDGDAGTSPTASGTAAADNTKQVCDEARALGEEYKKKATEILTRALQQAGTDETKSEQILGEIVPLSKEYKAKFEALGARANDQKLKDALTTLSKDLDNASAETAAESTGVAEETLTGICGA
ncbi:hypothetical protein GCM10009557_45420 [Virgisporangium ochraceum]|uniref:Lipoprotein n=1 Tax=Virgisporangium ochraceum TaxID=65505 RepID=A0A8J3ZPD1_9ACTN|nr:hypothetical protein Voc01_026440 [Virgisporangium ochraceum]